MPVSNNHVTVKTGQIFKEANKKLCFFFPTIYETMGNQNTIGNSKELQNMTVSDSKKCKQVHTFSILSAN